MKFFIFLVAFFIFSFCSVSAVTNVSECSVLNISGETYVLNQSISTMVNCFNITASNITFDGQNYLMEGQYTGEGAAVYLWDVMNVTIKNINSVGFSGSISIIRGSNNIILDSYVLDDIDSAINIINTQSNLLINVSTNRTTVESFYIQNSSHNRFINITAVSGQEGIEFRQNSSNNTFINPQSYNNNFHSFYDRDFNNNSIIYQNGFGELRFLTQNLTFSNNISLESINISHNYIFVNITLAYEFNISANITLYNTQTSFINPIISKDGIECITNCYNFTHLNSGNVTFNVTSFSNYTLIDSTPSLTLHVPSSSYNSSRTSIEVNVSTSDDFALDSVRIYLFNSTSLVNNTNISISGLSNSSFLNFTGLSDGRYYVNITINDSKGRTNYSITRIIGVDTTAPTVWTLDHGNPDTDSNAITWNTNEIANSTVYYSTSANPGNSDSKKGDNDLELNHSITLTSLESETKYYYEVRSCDAVGNCGSITNEDNSFTTDAESDSSDSGGSSTGGSDDDSTSFWTKDYSYSDKELKDKGTVFAVLEMSERARVKIDGKSYYLGMTRVRSASITFNITSSANPQTATLKTNESKDFEITGDAFFDIRIKLENIVNSTHANVSIRYVHESTGSIISSGSNITDGSETTSSNETNLGEEDALSDDVTYGDLIKPWMYIVVCVIILAIGGYFAYVKFLKNKGNEILAKKRVKVKHP